MAIMNKTEIDKETILVVDDAVENIDVLTMILGRYYCIKVATNGQLALKIAQSSNPPDLILLDISMPEMDGYQVCQQLKSQPETADIPVIFLTSKSDNNDESRGLSLGAVDYITKPIRPPIVKQRIQTQLSLYKQNRHLDSLVRQRTEELNKTQFNIINSLARAGEYKDNETGLHVERMSRYAQLIALAYGLDDDEAQQLLTVAPMHDIGKIGIPDHIMLKPGKLNKQEWEIMTTHPQIGADLIGEDRCILLENARIVALTHHEKWDGTGYPLGLSGDEIPLFGRIVAIADVFDALTSKRPYKETWPIEQAIEEIERSSGKHFDPALIPAFRQALPEMAKVMKKYAD